MTAISTPASSSGGGVVEKDVKDPVVDVGCARFLIGESAGSSVGAVQLLVSQLVLAMVEQLAQVLRSYLAAFLNAKFETPRYLRPVPAIGNLYGPQAQLMMSSKCPRIKKKRVAEARGLHLHKASLLMGSIGLVMHACLPL